LAKALYKESGTTLSDSRNLMDRKLSKFLKESIQPINSQFIFNLFQVTKKYLAILKAIVDSIIKKKNTLTKELLP